MKTTINEEAPLYRTGAITFLIPGVLYILMSVVIFMVLARGEYIDSMEALVRMIVEKPTLKKLNAVLGIIIDLNTFIGFLMLAFILKRVDRIWPVVAVVLIAPALLYDMQDGLTEWAMTKSYSTHLTDSATVQAANSIYAEQIYQYIYEVATPFFAIMIGLSIALMSRTILKDEFPGWIAYLGFVVATVSIIGGITTIFPLALSAGLWYVSIGGYLLRHSSNAEQNNPKLSGFERE